MYNGDIMKVGICTKCKKQGKVVMHHARGYEGDNKDNVQPYCHSCHRNIHVEARKSGKCTLPVKEIEYKSNLSSNRRREKELRKQIYFYETLMPHIQLQEIIQVWPNGVLYASRFHKNNGEKLHEVDI